MSEYLKCIVKTAHQYMHVMHLQYRVSHASVGPAHPIYGCASRPFMGTKVKEAEKSFLVVSFQPLEG